MTTTTEFDIIKIKNEFLNKLRYSLNVYDTNSRITETTTTFNGTGSKTNFSLSSSTMSYVKSVTVDNVALSFATDYAIIWRGSTKGSVELFSAPASGTDNVSVVWGKKGTSSSNFVFPDFPRSDLGESNYPRIGFEMTTNSDIAGLGGGCSIVYKNDILVQIKIVSLDTYTVDYLVNKLTDYINVNCKNFYYFNYIKPQSIASYDNFNDNTKKTFAKIVEFIIPDRFNIVTFA